MAISPAQVNQGQSGDMTRGHRTWHRLFWLIAAPGLFVLIFVFNNQDRGERLPQQTIQEAAKLGKFDTGDGVSR